MPEVFQYLDPYDYDDLERSQQLYAAAMEYTGAENAPGANIVITAQTAKMHHIGNERKYPVSMDLLRINLQYIGSPTGIWASDSAPDQNNNHISQNMYDVSYCDVDQKYNELRSNMGVLYVEDFDPTRVFYPTLRNVSGEINMSPMYLSFVAATIVHMAYGAWKTNVGSNLSDQQYTTNTIDYINREINHRFDNRFIYQVDSYMTPADQKRRYSWTSAVIIGVDDTKVVNRLNIVAMPIE